MFKLGSLKVQLKNKYEEYDPEVKAYRYKMTISITNIDTNIKKYFQYISEIIKYAPNDNKSLENALYCIFSDYNILNYCTSLEDFISEFGYSYQEGKKIYNKILKNYNKFDSLVDEETIKLLESHYENY